MVKHFRALLVMVAVVVSCTSYAQSIAEIDAKLAAMLAKITYWDDYRKENREDSLSDANTRLAEYLKKICTGNTATLTADFKRAKKERLNVISSEDHMLRLYSWDTRMGGSMRLYADYAQFKVNNSTRFREMKDTSIDGDYGCDYTGIASIHQKDGKTIYLVCSFAIESTKDRSEGITAYALENGQLKKKNIFKTKTKQLSFISYSYDMFASVKGDFDKDLPNIHLSSDRKKLYIPIVQGEVLTNKFLVYVFDGTNFVFDKNAK